MTVKALTITQYNQAIDNEFCKAVHADFVEDFTAWHSAPKRLRSCQARVYETDNYFALESYDTFVAVIRKCDYMVVDVLRFAYGYTNTSAQHIAKFIHDYTPYPWNNSRYTWRDLEKVK